MPPLDERKFDLTKADTRARKSLIHSGLELAIRCALGAELIEQSVHKGSEELRQSQTDGEATSSVNSIGDLLDKFVEWARKVELPPQLLTDIGVERQYENIAWLRVDGRKTFTVIKLQSNGFYSFESLGLETEEPLLSCHGKLEPRLDFNEEFAEVLDLILNYEQS